MKKNVYKNPKLVLQLLTVSDVLKSNSAYQFPTKLIGKQYRKCNTLWFERWIRLGFSDIEK